MIDIENDLHFHCRFPFTIFSPVGNFYCMSYLSVDLSHQSILFKSFVNDNIFRIKCVYRNDYSKNSISQQTITEAHYDLSSDLLLRK